MRRPSLSFCLCASLAFSALVACEDGPNQTSSPAPPNAASLWNNSNADAAVSGATQGYGGASIGGTNAEVISRATSKPNAGRRW